MFCAPRFLQFEMFRAFGNDVQHRRYYEHYWMDCAEVDARPFILYLQYLTYHGIGARQLQLQDFLKHKDIVKSIEKLRQLYHPETVLNLHGHCLELEGDILNALYAYSTSLSGKPRFNAANWHITLTHHT